MNKERIKEKIDELNIYLFELKEFKPETFEEYVEDIESKRACERVLHLLIETTTDICNLIVSGLKMGVPEDENNIFNKIAKKGIISKKMEKKLKDMRGFRNILIHRYGSVDDETVFEILSEDVKDFVKFREEILKFLE